MKTLDLSRSSVRSLAALALAILTLPGRLAAQDPADWTEAFPRSASPPTSTTWEARGSRATWSRHPRATS